MTSTLRKPPEQGALGSHDKPTDGQDSKRGQETEARVDGELKHDGLNDAGDVDVEKIGNGNVPPEVPAKKEEAPYSCFSDAAKWGIITLSAVGSITS